VLLKSFKKKSDVLFVFSSNNKTNNKECRHFYLIPWSNLGYGLPTSSLYRFSFDRVSLRDILVNRLLLCSLPQFFIDNLVRPADLKNLPDAGVDEDMDFLHGVQGPDGSAEC
jgi:hypothetical protein